MNLEFWGVLLVAFLAGLEGVIDEWEFHQPIVACALVGLVTGNLVAGLALGASLQLVTLGWMNIGSAVAPDAALGAVGAAWLVTGPAHLPVAMGVIMAIPLAVVGLWLTRGLRRIIVPLVARGDQAAAAGNLSRITRLQWLSVGLQGLRVVIPMVILMALPSVWMTTIYQGLPVTLRGGLRVTAGLLVIVSFAIVINMMASRRLWPFFFMGFACATDSHLNLTALVMIGVALAIIYLNLKPKDQHPQGGGSGTSADDDLDRELDDL